MRQSDLHDFDRLEAPAGRDGRLPERADILQRYGADALLGDPELARITEFAAELCEAPIALVNLIDDERQRFLARVGLDAPEPPLSISFCAHAIKHDELLLITDTKVDERFRNNPLVTGEPHIRFYAGVPLKSAEGLALGSLCVIDHEPRPAGLTELQKHGLDVLASAVKRRLGDSLAEMERKGRAEKRAERFNVILDAISQITFAMDADGRFGLFNKRWYETTGSEPPRTTEHWGRFIHPDDRRTTLDKWQRDLVDADSHEDEFRLRMADGTYRWMLSRVRPIDDAATGRSWFGTLTDIHDRRIEDEGRDLLNRELSHRIKNIFAVVASLTQTLSRRRPGSEQFAEQLSDIIRALGRAHDGVNFIERDSGNSLHELLTNILKPYEETHDERITIKCVEDLPVGPSAAAPLALIFHELATNSTKYGAFASDDGKVLIDCSTNGQNVHVIWQESGYRSTGDATADGFGSLLLRKSVEGQLGGSLDRRFTDKGYEVEMQVPCDNLMR